MIQNTSLMAYEEVQKTGRIAECYQRILSVLKSGKEYSNKEISLFTGLTINCVTPRVFELRQKGLIEFSNTRECRVTGRLVKTWRNVERQPTARASCFSKTTPQNPQHPSLPIIARGENSGVEN